MPSSRRCSPERAGEDLDLDAAIGALGDLVPELDVELVRDRLRVAGIAELQVDDLGLGRGGKPMAGDAGGRGGGEDGATGNESHGFLPWV